MEEYLKGTLEKLKCNSYAELNIVIGNESCDLDSAVSAIVYATFLHWQYDKIKCCKVCTRFNRDNTTYKDSIFVPLLNVDREDFALKTEVAYCLRQAGMPAEILVFRDDFNFAELAKNVPTKVTLVDHHVLAAKEQFLTPLVTEIIDHRPIERTKWAFKEDTRTTIECVGSCCTLVTQRIKDLNAVLDPDTEFLKDFSVCSDILHSTIILDTVNFSKEVDKATDHDVEIVQYLETVLNPSDVQTYRKSKLDSLVAARSDVTSLSAAQLLKKDVKVVGDVLVPSFPILVKEFLSRSAAVGAVSEALRTRGCSLALLLGMDLVGALKRDIAVWCADRDRANRLCDHLLSWQPSLDLLADKSDNLLDEYRYYTQRNLAASRKQYMPAITKFLNEEF